MAVTTVLLVALAAYVQLTVAEKVYVSCSRPRAPWMRTNYPIRIAAGCPIDSNARRCYLQVTCGSTLKLEHLNTNVRLHSHQVAYSRGSQQQSVTGNPSSDDANSYWLIKGTQVRLLLGISACMPVPRCTNALHCSCCHVGSAASCA